MALFLERLPKRTPAQNTNNEVKIIKNKIFLIKFPSWSTHTYEYEQNLQKKTAFKTFKFLWPYFLEKLHLCARQKREKRV
jgi:hypothetical protein